MLRKKVPLLPTACHDADNNEPVCIDGSFSLLMKKATKRAFISNGNEQKIVLFMEIEN